MTFLRYFETDQTETARLKGVASGMRPSYH